MTTEELKAHRRAICEALIEGKQCQVFFNGKWEEWSACTVAFRLFEPTPTYDIRIKPEPRKVWIGWHEECAVVAQNDDVKKWLIECYPNTNWQPVVEEVK